MPNKVYGFVYEIEIELEGVKKWYIGRKQLISVRKKKMGKKELAQITDKRLKKYHIIEKETDWQNYLGSNKELLSLIKEFGEEKLKLKKEILQYCFSELELKWREVEKIVCSGSMESEYYFNDNVRINQIKKFKF